MEQSGLQSSAIIHAILVLLLDVESHLMLYRPRIRLHPGVMMYPMDRPRHQEADLSV